jgi:hypothetical protein
MSQPEILRRCSSCGASISASALFCPECGKPTVTERAQDDAASEEPTAETTNDPAVATNTAVNVDQALPASSTAPINPVVDPGTETRVRQVRTAARGALEDKVKPRVDKMRKASTLVLDEAASDTGIRFLLVVVLLFMLFLVLLFLSKWMT